MYNWVVKLKDKLKKLPLVPGVYFFKNAYGDIIYIGKAAVLRNRVSSYFQKSKNHEPKTLLLIDEIADVDWVEVGSEVEALFLESEFIKRYKPPYNIDLRDDKHWNYVRIPMKNEWPAVSFVRRPLDDGAEYFGPFSEGLALKRAMRMLRRIFPYVTHEKLPKRACLDTHLGLCPNPEDGAITSAEYKRSLRKLMLYLSGQGGKLITQLEREMKRAAKMKDYEVAAKTRDQYLDLKALAKQMIFGKEESFDLTKDQALSGLADRLELNGIPRRIECYDISHIQGSDNVASMIVFTDGVADKGEYRKFKMRLKGNDDFAHMREVISRRFSGKPLAEWPKPDLVIIDGGKGQLSAALGAMKIKEITLPTIALAKREEEIIRPLPKNRYESIWLPRDSHVLKLLQRIRDEAHRFAVTYHSLLRGVRQTKSLLDDIPGIGPSTRKKLIKTLGSGQAVKTATESEIAVVVGRAKAELIRRHLGLTETPEQPTIESN